MRYKKMKLHLSDESLKMQHNSFKMIFDKTNN